MDIAILHYHLNRGGVTQVIANQLPALDRTAEGEDRVRVAVFFGGCARGWHDEMPANLRNLDVTMVNVPELGYDAATCRAQPEALAERLRSRLGDVGFSPCQTVLHVHNPSLGKNVSLPGALALLAGEGYAMVLQIHDFAEDFRPANYQRMAAEFGSSALARTLYPQASHIHYAVLSRRDFAVLTQAGVARDRLHLLPNAVAAVERFPSRDAARRELDRRFGISPRRRFLLYPVRGIRRKALGETLLWSLMVDEAAELGVTLAPRSPAERESYLRWKNLANELRLACHFELGEEDGLPLARNLAAADCVLTTSIAEGFGMAFLEPWMSRRALVGRRLPEITEDFEARGLRLDGLYDVLRAPVSWIGRDVYAEALATGYDRVLTYYGRPTQGVEPLRAAALSKVRNDAVDFADLDETNQEGILRAVSDSPARRRQLLELNPAITSSLTSATRESGTTIRRNREIIGASYSLAAYGRRLRGIYRDALRSHREHRLTPLSHSNRILDRFLAFRRYRPIHGGPL